MKHFILWTSRFIALVLMAMIAGCSDFSTKLHIETQTTADVLPDASRYPWTGTRAERIRYVQELLRKKSSYTGPIQVQVLPGFTQPASSPAKNSAFSIQAIPSGPIVFQEVFTKGIQDLEETRSVRVLDTSKRYTLHVHKLGSGDSDSQINVNINGTNWIKTQDFSAGASEAQRSSLLLNANNSLQVRLKGLEGTAVVLTLVEGGEAGTILRRRDRPGLADATQATHISQNDTNIFDPYDPESLGDLEPYQGERIDSEGDRIGAVRINQDSTLEFQSGALILEFHDSTQGLAEFQRLYGAEVLSQRHQRFLLKLDLTKAPLANLPALLREYNQSIPENIENITFGSLASLQTFAILMDAALHHHELLLGLELNGVLYPQQTTPAPACLPMPALQDWEYLDTNLGKSWWLVDTKVGAPLWNPAAPTSTATNPYVSGAWDYSIGTGVRVAVIDKGFKTSHKEISRRVKVDGSLGNQVGANDVNDVPGSDGRTVTPDHGHLSVMTGFAEKDNELGTAGVAPNATVLPYSYKGGKYWEIEDVIEVARIHADILSMSFSGEDYTRFTFGIFGGATGQGMMDRIKETVEAGKIVIVAAGNSQKNLAGFIPANHPLAIPVGAVTSDINGISGLRRTGSTPNANNLLNPYWCARIPAPVTSTNTKPEALSVADYSNFGPDKSLVWAPGDYIKVQQIGNDSTTAVKDSSGTSAATPFVAGVAALMVSRNPGIPPAQVKTILTQQARTALVSPSTNMTSAGYSDTYLVDVEQAVELAALAINLKKLEMTLTRFSGHPRRGGPLTILGKGDRVCLQKPTQQNSNAMPWLSLHEMASRKPQKPWGFMRTFCTAGGVKPVKQEMRRFGAKAS